jgi:hypothetical protein
MNSKRKHGANRSLPTGFRNWVAIGGPLTPNGLNGGPANFPEFHNIAL